MRIFKIVVSGVVTYFIVAFIFVVSFIIQSPNKTNGLGAFIFPLRDYSFIIVASLACVLVMWFVGRRKVRSS
jgi:hypothetical protein